MRYTDTMPKKNSQGGRAATKADIATMRLDFKLLWGDLDDLALVMEKNFRRVDERIDKLEERMNDVQKTLHIVVATLNSLVETVKEVARDVKELKEQNLGERVDRLEDEVLELKTRVR